MELNRFFNKTTIIIILSVIFILGVIWGIYTHFKSVGELFPVAEIQSYTTLKTDINSDSVPYENIFVSKNIQGADGLPESATIYSYNNNVKFEDITNKINSLYSLNETDRLNSKTEGSVSMSSRGNYSVHSYFQNEIILFTNSIDPNLQQDLAFTANPDIDSYDIKAREFLSSIGLNPDLYTLTSTQFLTYPSLEPEPIDNPLLAGLIEFNYEALVDGHSVIDDSGSLSPSQISVMIDKNYEIRKANINNSGSTTKELYDVSLIDEDKIYELLNSKKGILVDSGLDTSEEIRDVKVRSIELMYYLQDGKLYPIYVVDVDTMSYDYTEGDGKLFLDAVSLENINDK